MVTVQEPVAADVGVAVLKSGGNAVDAAVAIGFALAVTHPFAGNIGGGGFMLIRFADGRVTFVDFREAAPLAASRDMYLDAKGEPTRDSIEGWRASGVPGTVRGLGLAHSKYGTKPWISLVGPAVKLARDGYPLSYGQAEQLKGERTAQRLSKFPESKRIFLKGGAFYEPDDVFQQPDLARTLDRIARNGPDEFYKGQIAANFAAEMKKNGGLITAADLEQYRAVERKPLECDYKGYHVITAPPPSSGGVGIVQMLGMLEGSGYEKSGWGSAATIHYVAEAMRRYYADRSQYLGDPDFYKVPLEGLLDPAYIQRRARGIDPNRATPSDQVGPGKPAGAEGSDTTHYNVIDAEGNAVAVTYTLNAGYGSGVTVPGLGFLLNDEMDDFAAKPGFENMFHLVQGESNAIAPRKRPLSSMTPTIVTRNGKFEMMLGAPGGSYIITAVLQGFLNMVDFGMNPQDAVDAPRMHHQWKPDVIAMEHGYSPDTMALLRARGHEVRDLQYQVTSRLDAIRRGANGWLEGGSDGRGQGKAAGY